MIPPSGADEQVYTYIAKTLCNALNILSENISSMGNKRALIEESAADVRIMLNNGCEFVFIIWDGMPKWGGTGRCGDHQAELLINLQIENVTLLKLFIVASMKCWSRG